MRARRYLVLLGALIALLSVCTTGGAASSTTRTEIVPQAVQCTVWLRFNPPCPVSGGYAEQVWNDVAGGPQYSTSSFARRTGVGWQVYGGQQNNGVATCLGPQAQVLIQYIRQDGSVLFGQRSPFGSCGEYYPQGSGGEYVRIQLRFYRADCPVSICNSRWIASWSNWF